LYQIKLEPHQLQNKTITKIGFAYDNKSTNSMISECAVNYTKTDGQNLIISGLIQLDEIADGVNTSDIFKGEQITGGSLLGGDNPLIKVLLGMDAFDKTKINVKNGSLKTPLVPFERGGINVREALNFDIEIGNKSMIINTAQSTDSLPELIVFYQGIACARFLPLNAGVVSEQRTAVQNDEVVINGNTAAVSNVVLPNGNSVMPQVHQMPSVSVLIREEDFKINPNSKVIADPLRNYFAVFDFGDKDQTDPDVEAEITLYKFADSRLVPCGFMKGRDGTYCADGFFVLYKKDSIEIINLERTNNSHLALDIKPGARNETAFISGSFVIVTIAGRQTKIFSVNQSGQIFSQREQEFNTDNIGLVNFHSAIAVVPLGGEPISYTPFSIGSQFDMWMTNAVVANFIRTDRPVFESGRLIGTSFLMAGVVRFINEFASVINSMADTFMADAFIYQRHIEGGAIQPFADGVGFRIFDINEANGGLKAMFNNSGRLVVFSNTGRILIYAFESENLRVTVQGIVSGNAVSITRTALVKRNGAVKIKFSQRE